VSGVIDTSSPDARARLAAALGIRRWVDEVAGSGPYASVDALVAAGERAAADLSDGELDEAVAHHPRIGERAEGDGSSALLSASEQAALGRNDEGVDAAIARGNEVYEQRFGRVFLIRAAGRSRQEVLDELQRRLKDDDATEAAEAKEQLRQIAALRLAALFGEDA
jgi:2-oxo-4-hydroxy-4-carboxy-5-ureidoimidazoline decarboxylase